MAATLFGRHSLDRFRFPAHVVAADFKAGVAADGCRSDGAAADFEADFVVGREELRSGHIRRIVQQAEHGVARGEQFSVGEDVQRPGRRCRWTR